MNIARFLWSAALAAATLCLAPAAHAGETFPAHPIRLLVAFPPGGSTTVVAQLLAEKLAARLGQPVIVENRPGADGVIASQDLLKAPADGYTLLMIVSTHAINAVMKANLPYDTRKDFQPVSTLYKLELVMVAHPSVQAGNLQEFIALAKARPASVNFAAGDSGGLTYLAAQTFNAMAGTTLQVVPYKGSGPALSDTLGGHVQAYFSSPTAVIEYIRSGKLRAYAISGRQPSASLPEVPTFAASGLPQFEGGSWAGILAPAGTPPRIVDRLSQEIAQVMGQPEVRQKLQVLGLEPYVAAPGEFAALIDSDIERLGRIAKTAGLAPAP